MNELQVIAWLETLTEKQFSEFFYRAVATRCTSDVPEWQGHLVLADADRETDESWSLSLIALPDPDEYDQWADDSPICQSGTCPECGACLRSIAKHVVCPVCKSKANCT